MIEKRIVLILIMVLLGASGCATQTDKPSKEEMPQVITANEAKQVMDSSKNFIVLDVREQEEYDEGHIPGAILIPYTQIEERIQELGEDKNVTILVYCRSGRRSNIAAQQLVKLGFQDVRDFGGIIDWEYEITK